MAVCSPEGSGARFGDDSAGAAGRGKVKGDRRQSRLALGKRAGRRGDERTATGKSAELLARDDGLRLRAAAGFPLARISRRSPSGSASIRRATDRRRPSCLCRAPRPTLRPRRRPADRRRSPPASWPPPRVGAANGSEIRPLTRSDPVPPLREGELLRPLRPPSRIGAEASSAPVARCELAQFRGAQPANAGGRRLAQDFHDRILDAHRLEIGLHRPVDGTLFVDFLHRRQMLDAFGLLLHRRDLVDADLRHGADKPLDAAGEDQRTGGGAKGAADDRPAASVGTVAGALGAIGDQRPRDRHDQSLRADQQAHRQRVADRASVRRDENRQAAPAESGDRPWRTPEPCRA